MYKLSSFTKQSYKTGEVAEILGVTNKTIQNYDKWGKLRVCRTAGNRRCIMRDDLVAFLKEKDLLLDDMQNVKRDVVYARVSSHEQKEKGDLDRQALFIIENVPDLINPLVMKEVGSGLNDQRKQLQKLLKMVCLNEVNKVYVTYKDRLTRFGYHYLKTIFEINGVEIIVVKDEKASKTVQDELVEDMMSLIACFSGKLYGMRSKKSMKQEGRK